MGVKIVDERGQETVTADLTMVSLNIGGSWVAVCRELGIQAEGRTRDDALDQLKTDMAELLIIARDEEVPAGTRLSDGEMKALLVQHRQEEGPVQTASWRPRV